MNNITIRGQITDSSFHSYDPSLLGSKTDFIQEKKDDIDERVYDFNILTQEDVCYYGSKDLIIERTILGF